MSREVEDGSGFQLRPRRKGGLLGEVTVGLAGGVRGELLLHGTHPDFFRAPRNFEHFESLSFLLFIKKEEGK